MELLRSLSFVVPGCLVAAVALRAGAGLRATLAALAARAAEQQRQVPPLVDAYFRGTSKVLLVCPVLYLGLVGADVAVSLAAAGHGVARILGYACGLVLMVSSFVLLMQGTVDRRLKLQDLFARRAYPIAGGLGMCIAAWGMTLVTVQGRVWA